MNFQNSGSRFNQAVSCLSPRLKTILSGVPDSAKQSAFEVRLRVGKPMILTCAERPWFVDANSQLLNLPKMPYIVTQNDIADSIVSMCAHSVHSHQQEFKNGFISIRGGHRAGICGTAVVSDSGAITAVREITSVNLRIAREVPGAANALMERIFAEQLCGCLIIGIPSSGKTTILRDLARQLSSGVSGRFVKVAVVDERCELGAVFDGIPQNNLGYGSDILSGYPKAFGIEVAVRTLSPQVIICDEIGGGAEVNGILESINAGVKIIATAHAGSVKEILRRPQMARLMESGAFSRIVLLGGSQKPGEIRQIVKTGDLLDDKDFRNDIDCPFHDNDWSGARAGAYRAGFDA